MITYNVTVACLQERSTNQEVLQDDYRPPKRIEHLDRRLFHQAHRSLRQRTINSVSGCGACSKSYQTRVQVFRFHLATTIESNFHESITCISATTYFLF